MSSKGKVQLHCNISEDVDKRLRAFIAQKYVKYEKGLLSIEVEDAIKYWVSLHTREQSQLTSTPINPMPSASLIFARVRQYLAQTYFCGDLRQGTAVPTKLIKEAIGAIRGTDHRTIEKWLHIFSNFHLIKAISTTTWEVM